MLHRHRDGRIHLGVLFQEASTQCTDDCGTGTVCFEHMVKRLQELASYIADLEKKIKELTTESKEVKMGADCGDCKMKTELLILSHETISKIAARAEIAELQNGELVAALQHMKSCGSCCEDSWETCEGGRAALAALEKANPEKGKCECVWLDGGPVGDYRDRRVPCSVHDKKKG